MGLAGYAVIMFDFLGFRQAFSFSEKAVATLGTSLLFYGMYYGVLGRDCAEVITGSVANALGYVKKDDDEPQRLLPPNTCALCGEDLLVGQEDLMMDGGSGGRGGEFATSKKALRNRKMQLQCVKLQCGHSFHSECIRGWSIVGKKNKCPNCGEKVNTKHIVGSSPWQKQSLIWANLLDAVRYMVVWNPIILLGVTAILHAEIFLLHIDMHVNG